jgi:hypothetical protein
VRSMQSRSKVYLSIGQAGDLSDKSLGVASTLVSRLISPVFPFLDSNVTAEGNGSEQRS